jgi:RNA polymerase sigma-70 factor (ECF subfamily)
VDDDHRAAHEATIRQAAERGELATAATGALHAYGDELLNYLRATAGNDDLAHEAFSELGEDLWRGLPSFRWQSSLRSWLYTLARHALGQLRRDPRRRLDRNVPLSIAPDVEAAVRTLTLTIQRTDIKDEFRVLREQLTPDEHELLLLRLDRQLSWREIAAILGADQDVTAQAATLRKRFERTKARLRELAIARGLIP